MELVFIIAFAITFVMLLKLLGKTRQERLLDALPGPSGYPFMGNFFDILQSKENFLLRTFGNESKFGPLYKIWVGSMPIVHISKVRYLEMLFEVKETIQLPNRNSLIMKSLKNHPFSTFKNKSIVFTALNSKSPQAVINITTEKCETLIKEIQKQLLKNDILDRQTVSLCVLDTIFEITLGVNIKSQLRENFSFVTSLLLLNKLSNENRKVRFYSETLFQMTSYGKEFRYHLNMVQSFLNKIIQDRTRRTTEDDGNKNVANILDDILSYSGAYTIPDIQNEILSIITTTLDSVDMSIHSVLSILGQYMTAQHKIRKEIEAVCAKKTENEITIKDLQKMVYFDRVVKETLRLYPPCPFVLRELEKDVKIGKYLIPCGTAICIQVVNLHRDPESFPSQENFDPDNFLPHKVEKRSRFAFIPFGTPEGICIGQKLTEIIQRTILTNIIKNFKMEKVGKSDSTPAVSDYIDINRLDIKFEVISKP